MTKAVARPTPASSAQAKVADKQRRIQKAQDKKDAAAGAKKSASRKKAVQTGRADYPANPMPPQHLEKPGLEADMQLRPLFMAPGYKGSGKLEGMKALITGGDSGIGRAVAVLFAREGADITIVYLDEHVDAKETKRCIEAEGCGCLTISGDVPNLSPTSPRNASMKPCGPMSTATFI